MRTFDYRHYTFVGRQTVIIEGRSESYWCFKCLASAKAEGIIMVLEAKYVEAERVQILKKDGSVENRIRIRCES